MTKYALLFSLLLGGCFRVQAALLIEGDTARENEFYKIVDVPIPQDVILEVGGLAFTDNDKLGVSTRRGEVWLIDNPYSQRPVFNRFASGLHEPLGLTYQNGSFYLSQRGELSQLIDKNSDGIADVYKTIYSWDLSGNYHEYSYGPKLLPNGDMLVTLNLAWVGYGESFAKWRGWLIKISISGEMNPIATGLRSPAGYGVSPQGDIFFAENQGDWVGSGRITHLETGDFAGNPAGLNWTSEPESPLSLKRESILPGSGLTLYQYSKLIPDIKPPAIWFPHTIMGISTSDILYDTSDGDFGPFSGQMFVGDQGHSKIMRVFMEKINGVYQGACFPFKEGFSSGVLRMVWGSDYSMFVGMTNRGWGSTGKDMYGLQRLVWTGKTPFEIKEMRLKDNGFELEFTKPLDRKTASDPLSYDFSTFTYKYQKKYGSDIIDLKKCMIQEVVVSEDGKTVRLTIHGMRKGYIHALNAQKLRDSSGRPLLHETAYYTVNEVRGGGKFKSTPVISAAKTSSTGRKQLKRINQMPKIWDNKADVIIKIGTAPGLKFDMEEFEVKKGARVELIFNNNDDMLHNLVIVKPGDAVNKVGAMAERLGLNGPSMNYVPDTEMVLFHTGMTQPESTEKIYFTAPSKPGIYRYVCTFPGHSQSMRGTMIVK